MFKFLYFFIFLLNLWRLLYLQSFLWSQDQLYNFRLSTLLRLSVRYVWFPEVFISKLFNIVLAWVIKCQMCDSLRILLRLHLWWVHCEARPLLVWIELEAAGSVLCFQRGIVRLVLACFEGLEDACLRGGSVRYKLVVSVFFIGAILCTINWITLIDILFGGSRCHHDTIRVTHALWLCFLSWGLLFNRLCNCKQSITFVHNLSSWRRFREFIPLSKIIRRWFQLKPASGPRWNSTRQKYFLFLLAFMFGLYFLCGRESQFLFDSHFLSSFGGGRHRDQHISRVATHSPCVEHLRWWFVPH